MLTSYAAWQESATNCELESRAPTNRELSITELLEGENGGSAARQMKWRSRMHSCRRGLGEPEGELRWGWVEFYLSPLAR
jgi:hypothetical protein